MIIGIDESGTHLQHGIATVAAVIVAEKDIDHLNTAIMQAEQDLAVPGFHWAKDKWRYREALFLALQHAEMKVRIAYTTSPSQLQRGLDTALVELLQGTTISRLLIDGKKPRVFVRQLKSSLRKAGLHTTDLKLVGDTAYPIVRVADAMAGAARIYLDPKRTMPVFIEKQLRKNVELIQKMPLR